MNEKLQSTKEETQASKKEVQFTRDELQRKQKELDAANALVQNLFQSTDLASVFVDRELRVTRFTPAVSSIARLEAHDVGRLLFEILPEPAGTGVREDMEEVLRGLAPREREIWLGHGPRCFLRRVLPYWSLTQEVEGLVLTFVEITDRKRAEAQRAQLSAIVEGSQDAIIGHAPDGTITSWNRAAETIFGYSKEEMLGRPVSDIVPAERASEMPAAYSKLLRGEKVARFDSQCVNKSGRRIDVSLALSPIRDGHGQLVGFSSVTRDITELLCAAEQQARLAAIVESSDDAIVSKTLEGVVTSWNQGAQRIFGYAPEEIIGKPINVIIPDDRQEEEPAILSKLRQGQRVDHYETLRRRKDGQLINVSVTISPVRDSTGRIIGASKIGRDITARKQMEQELILANENLERQVAERTAHLDETVRSLEGVCYSMAHDLRSPLRSLHGFAQILLAEYGSKLDDMGRLYAERMIKATARMESLIRDLLEFAKLGHIDLPSEPLDLVDELAQVLEQLAPEISAKGAQVHSPAPLKERVMANRTALRQVLGNVIGNALKFVAPGVTPQVVISAEIREGTMRISVHDNGIGIALEHQSRVFGLFQRLYTAERYPGTGVGLAIVKRGVERMGGKVSVVSKEGKGSCFVIELPLGSS